MNFAFLQRGTGDAYVIIERFFLAYPCPSPSIAHPRILSSRRRRPSLQRIRAGASYPPCAGSAPPPLQHPCPDLRRHPASRPDCPDLRRRPASRPDGSNAWRPYRPPRVSVPPHLQAPNASSVRHPCMLRVGNWYPKPKTRWVFTPLGHEFGSLSRPVGLLMDKNSDTLGLRVRVWEWRTRTRKPVGFLNPNHKSY